MSENRAPPMILGQQSKIWIDGANSELFILQVGVSLKNTFKEH
jgi:hypothetical protein